MPAGIDRMSCGRDKVPAHTVSMSARAYSVYRGKDTLSSGRDPVSGSTNRVSACFDQMSA